MNVSFTPEAEADLDAIFDYLAEHDDATQLNVIVIMHERQQYP